MACIQWTSLSYVDLQAEGLYLYKVSFRYDIRQFEQGSLRWFGFRRLSSASLKADTGSATDAKWRVTMYGWPVLKRRIFFFLFERRIEKASLATASSYLYYGTAIATASK